MPRYSDERKEAVLRKMLPPHNRPLAALAAEEGIDISTGEVSILQRRFVLDLQRLHAAGRDAMRQAFAHDGGWPLQIDATGEDGRGTLLIAYAGWRRWVLGSRKIPRRTRTLFCLVCAGSPTPSGLPWPWSGTSEGP